MKLNEIQFKNSTAYPALWFRAGGALAFLSLLSSCAWFPLDRAKGTPPGSVKHVVVFWLKRPGNSDDRASLISASKMFRRIGGVISVEAGKGLPSSRPGVEPNFDLCAVITFTDRNALKRYESDPRHLQAVQLVLKPLVRKIVVYNYIVE